jgi:hypothetical protein
VEVSAINLNVLLPSFWPSREKEGTQAYYGAQILTRPQNDDDFVGDDDAEQK